MEVQLHGVSSDHLCTNVADDPELESTRMAILGRSSCGVQYFQAEIVPLLNVAFRRPFRVAN